MATQFPPQGGGGGAGTPQVDVDSFRRPPAENTSLYDPQRAQLQPSASSSHQQLQQQLQQQPNHQQQPQQQYFYHEGAASSAGRTGSISSTTSTSGMQAALGGSAPGSATAVDKLVNEIQAAYFDITRLEERSAQLIASLDPYGAHADKAFQELYTTQTALVNKYFDFMFLAHHPSGNSVTRSLVRKYKIALRLWNKGILKYLDLLRTHAARNQDAMTKFIFHCFSLLTMLVDRPYDYRHMWLEALGDIARFSMAVGSVSNGDWRGISQYWYCRAANRSPGVGRLFHHCAVVCIYRLDSLYYFCKSLLALQPFAPSSETILSLFESNAEGEGNTPVAAFIKLHELAFRGGDQAAPGPAASAAASAAAAAVAAFGASSGTGSAELTAGSAASNAAVAAAAAGGFVAAANSGLLPYVLSAVRRDHEFLLRGAMLALCNIAALMSYGSRTNALADYFFESFAAAKAASTSGNSPEAQPGQPSQPSQPTQPQTQEPSIRQFRPKSTISFLLPFEMLRQFLVLETNVALPHVLVWMHYLAALSAAPALAAPVILDARFPSKELAAFLNRKLEAVKETLKEGEQPGLSLRERIVRWKSRIQATGTEDLLARLNRQTPGFERRGAFPGIRQRPLPEELLLVGYVWAQGVINPQWHKDYESATTDEPFPGHPGLLDYVPVRIVRIYEVALNVVATGTWLHFDGHLFSIDYDWDPATGSF